MKNSFQNIKVFLIKIWSIVSNLFNHLLSNPKFSKYTSFVIALVIVVVIALGDGIGSLLNLNYESGVVLSGLPVSMNVDLNEFEISGAPKTVDAYIVGDLSEIQQIAQNRNLQIGLDLRNYDEGTHNVKLVVIGSTENTKISLTPSNVNVELRRKVEKKYAFSYDFINKSTTDDLLYGEPKFEFDAITVKASEKIQSEIKLVKAIIDVNQQNSEYSGNALIVAYNHLGERLNVTTIPEKMNVSVPITKPSKEVPIKIRTTGKLNDSSKSIDSIEMSDSVTTILGQGSLLDGIKNVEVVIPLSQIESDSKIVLPVNVVSNITSTVKNVSISITLGEKQTKELKEIPILILNNTSSYKIEILDESDKKSDIQVNGTQRNLDNLSVESIRLYPDLSNIVEGEQVVSLLAEKPNTLEVIPVKSSIRIKVTK